jgi:uncharacterized membrane protein
MRIIEPHGGEAVTKTHCIFKHAMSALLIAASLVLFISCTRQPSYPPPPMSGQDVVLDVSTLQLEIPQFYTYQYQDKPISFFVLKLQDRVLSFLDACVTCNPHKQGYRYDDGFVTCRYCNMKFSIYTLEKGLGSCYPIKVEGRMENGKYLIPLALLEKEASKF